MSSLEAYAPHSRHASMAVAAERRRIERDLHDGAQSLLVAVRLKLGLAADRAAEIGDPELHGLLVELGEEAQAALDGVRSIASGAFPPLLALRGLAPALAAEGDRAAIQVRVAGRAPRSRRELEAAVYYSCMEALQNAAKHAGGRARVTIGLAWADDRLSFAVEDDGIGFARARRPRSRGLRHMRDRIATVGGELSIVSRPGGGTTVHGCVPWPACEEVVM